MSDAEKIKALEAKVRQLEIQLEQALTVPTGIESKTLHDLNGALAVAQGQAHIALLDLPSQAKARVSVEEFCKATRRALYLLTVLHEKNEQTTEPDQTTQSSPEEHHGSGSVLFVDDEEDMRDMVQRVLEHYGYKVHLASHGKEALEIFKKDHLQMDLVFMDMTMPNLNGLEVFKLMREIDPSIPIVMTSGYSEVNLADRWPELGMNGFLCKPCDLNKLLSTVKSAIRTRRTH
jgi:two-component system, cell cycle sensor histidine kinase and response regulator CckA